MSVLTQNTKAWLEGILAAVISGAASSAVAFLSDHVTVTKEVSNSPPGS